MNDEKASPAIEMIYRARVGSRPRAIGCAAADANFARRLPLHQTTWLAIGPLSGAARFRRIAGLPKH